MGGGGGGDRNGGGGADCLVIVPIVGQGTVPKVLPDGHRQASTKAVPACRLDIDSH